MMSASSPIGSGRVSRTAKLHRRAGRRHRFGLDPQRLVEPLHQVLAEAPRQPGARRAEQIADPPQAQPRQLVHRVRLDPQRGDRQRAPAPVRVPPTGAMRTGILPDGRGAGAAGRPASSAGA